MGQTPRALKQFRKWPILAILSRLYKGKTFKIIDSYRVKCKGAKTVRSCLHSLLKFSYIHTYLIDHSPLGLLRPMKQTTEMNLTRWESQLAGGRPVGFAQAQPRSWTRDYLKQIQLVVRAGLTTRPRCLLHTREIEVYTHILQRNVSWIRFAKGTNPQVARRYVKVHPRNKSSFFNRYIATLMFSTCMKEITNACHETATYLVLWLLHFTQSTYIFGPAKST